MATPDVRDAIELIDTAVKTGGQTQEILAKPGVVEALEVIGCDISVRPKDAPTFEDIKAHVAAVRREPQRLTVEFDARASADVAAFVAAEQQCCSDVVFSMLPEDRTIMQVSATADVLDMVQGWMTRAPGSPPAS